MQIIAHQFRAAEFARSIWSAVPPSGTALDDVLAPAYWVHVQSKLTVGDRIEVSPESGEWMAELLVRAVSANGPVLAVLMKHDFTKATGEPGTWGKDYEVKYANNNLKWRVIRKADKHVLVDKLPTREAGDAWLTENIKTEADLV